MVDGFNGNRLPPKASIQEIRINANPYSPENDQPGGNIIQIVTKPGSNTMHGQFYTIYNKEAFNSRSPLLAQSKRPPYKSNQFGANLSGAIKKNKSSFSVDLFHRKTTENSFVYADRKSTRLNSSH